MTNHLRKTAKKSSIAAAAVGLLLATSLPAEARTGTLHIAAGAMALTNSSTVNGSGPSGTTVLTQWDFMISHNWMAGGLFFQYDKQGSNQTDTMFGPKVEVFWRVFFAEFGYGFIMNRAFTDRTIATQKGTGFYYGLGVHVPLGGGGGGGGEASRPKGLFLQFTYKFRTQNVSSQDGVLVPYTIRQWDGYPLFGLGYGF